MQGQARVTNTGGYWHEAARYNGVHTARVIELVDPDGQGRVKVRLVRGEEEVPLEAWARIATLMAGNNKGSWFIPDVGDEVLVAFEAGDPRKPFVLGGLWNGQDAPPESMDGAGANGVKSLRLRSGLTIRLQEDREGASITLETPGGRRLVLSDAIDSEGEAGVIEIEDGQGNKVTIDRDGVSVVSDGVLRLSANEGATIEATSLDIKVGTANVTGILYANIINASSIVADGYTNGAGNHW